MATKLVPVGSVVTSVRVNDQVELLYPSSKTGEDTPRRGRVEKVDAERSLLTVAIDPPESGEHRSFKFGRISGGTVTIIS